MFVSWLGKLLSDTRGATAVAFGITVPALVVVSGFSLEYAGAVVQRSHLQNVADISAVAGAKQMSLSTPENDASVMAVVKAIVDEAISDKSGSKGQAVTRSVVVDRDNNKVLVSLTQPNVNEFLVAGLNISEVSVTAEASVVGTLRTCVLALDESAENTIGLDSNARGLICSAGGNYGGATNFEPEVLTDCPPIDDPLSNRSEPSVGGCTYTDLEVIDETRTLLPGTYCGGLRIDGNAVVTLEPGVYIIKDGPFIVDSNSIVNGTYVSLFFTGDTSTFTFNSNANVSLSAPRDGAMAGILMFESRSAPLNRTFNIFSNYTRNLLGTIYLSRGHLNVDADNPVADQSAYTAVVVRRLLLNSGPNLVLNTNYGATDIPVPENIKGLSSNVALSK